MIYDPSHEKFNLSIKLVSVVKQAGLSFTWSETLNMDYRKVPKFSDVRKLCCNLPKIQEKRPNLWVLCQKDATGIANSEDPDQTAPLGAV